MSSRVPLLVVALLAAAFLVLPATPTTTAAPVANRIPLAGHGPLSPAGARWQRSADLAGALGVDGTLHGAPRVAGTVDLGPPSTVNAVTAVATPAISAPADVIVGEGDGYLDLAVSLSAPGLNAVSVAYTTTNGSAGGGNGCNADYTIASGTLNFAPGETTKVVRVDLLDCAADGFESFTFNLSVPVNATIARASARIGIVDNHTLVATPSLFVRDAVVDQKAGSVSIPVLLGGPTGQVSASTVTVDYATSNAGAIAGTDYTATSGTLTFAPGQTVKNVVVPIIDNTTPALAQSFTLTLSSPTNATIANGTGVVVIGAHDATAVATPAISAPADVIVGEGDGYLDLAVSLSAPGLNAVSVAYTTTNGSAGGGNGCNADYTIASGTLNFAPGETTKVVRVDLLDCAADGFESFTFNLSVPVNATIARASARIGIVDNHTLVPAAAAVAGPSLFRNSVPTPGEINLDLATVVLPTLVAGVGIIVLVPFPGTLFNSTLRTNYAELMRRGRRARRRLRNAALRPWFALAARLSVAFGPQPIALGEEAPMLTSPPAAEQRHDFWWTWPGVGVFVLLTALLSSFLDPAFWLDAASLPTFIGMLVGLVLILAAFDVPSILYYRRSTIRFWPRALPGTFVVALACVAISRLTDFHPGYLYGLVITMAVAANLGPKVEGRLLAAGVILTLVVAAVAWFALGVVTPAARASSDPFLVGTQTVLSMLVSDGVQVTAFALLPLSFLAGESVRKWNPWVHAVLWLSGLAAFGIIILNPQNGYLSDSTRTPLLTIVALFVLFSAGSVGFWKYFRDWHMRMAKLAPTVEESPR
jgi:hypothetical protein